MKTHEALKSEFVKVMNDQIANENNADRISNLELIREYFSSNNFRVAMADMTYAEIN